MFNVFLTNLGKYNEGELVGKWVSLPISKEKLKEELLSIEIDGYEYEEYFITDYEVDGIYRNIPKDMLGEYSNITTLSNIAETLSKYNKEQEAVFSVFMEEDYGHIGNAFDCISSENYTVFHKSKFDYAKEYVEELNIPKVVQNNIDFETLGEELCQEATEVELRDSFYTIFINN